MLPLHDRPAQLCDGVSRRELLRVGGLSVVGLTLPALLRAAEQRRHVTTIRRYKIYREPFGRRRTWKRDTS